MSKGAAQRIVLLGFAGSVVAVTFVDLKRRSRAPAPGELLASAAVYALAGVFSEFAPGLGAALAVAWTLGLLYKLNATPARQPSAAGVTAPGQVGHKPAP